jgi:hypothetical protein
VALRCTTIEKKIQSRCLGLLECNLQHPPVEITPEAPETTVFGGTACLDHLFYYAGFSTRPRRVQYMHRTVADFFDSSESWADLQADFSEHETTFDTNLGLCLSSLVQLKRVFTVMAYGSWTSATTPFWELIGECLQYASRVKPSSHESTCEILDDLERTATYIYSKQKQNAGTMWPNTWVHTRHRNYPADCNRFSAFLALTMNYDLGFYLKAKLKPDPVNNTLDQKQLDMLLKAAVTKTKKNPGNIKALLSNGADPNALPDATPWQILLCDTICRKHRKDTSPSHRETSPSESEIIQDFITSEADLQAKCPSTCRVSASEPSLYASVLLMQMGNPIVMGMVLEHGIDPNHIVEGSSLWQETLRYTYLEVPKAMEFSCAKSIAERWIKIFKLLLEYQADPSQTITITNQKHGKAKAPKFISIFTIIRELFSKWDSAGSSELEALLPKGLNMEVRKSHGLFAAAPSPTSPASPLSPTFAIRQRWLDTGDANSKRRSFTDLFSKIKRSPSVKSEKNTT